MTRVDAANSHRLRESLRHLLLGRRWYRAVALVEHVVDRNTGCDRPVHRLEVVVHRVFDAANRIDHERRGVIVKRIAAMGIAERLG